MKRTALKRKTPLTQRSYLARVSANQALELAKRRLLKQELFIEQEGKCAKCGKYMTFYNEASDNYPHLSHKRFLSRGGVTRLDNLEVLCYHCHRKKHDIREG